MKIFHIAGGAIAIVTAGAIMVVMYFLFGFYFFSVDGLKQQNIALSIVGGILLSLSAAALCFNLLYWPGARLMAFAGMVSSFPLLITCIILVSTKEKLRVYYKRMLYRSATAMIITTLFYSTPLAPWMHHYLNPNTVQQSDMLKK